MKCSNASTLFLQVTNTLSDIDNIVIAGADSLTQSYLAKYLVVYVTGIYEQAIEEIVWEFASQTGQSEVENFVANQLDKNFRNPDMGNIINIVKQFSSGWADQLRALDDRNKNAIDSIVTNKNLIAHGQSSIITIQDIKNFHTDATVVIEKIDNLFLGV